MKNRTLITSLLLGVFFFILQLSTGGAENKQNTVNYARPFEPPTHPAFIPLPPGTIEPSGWLRDWCLAARDGYTGHMDDIHDEFKRAWAADHTMTGERLNWPKGGWPYEGGGYWFDGLAKLGYLLHDDALIQQAKQRFDVVVNHMNTNSILFLWWLNKNNPDDIKGAEVSGGWPFWACGLMGRSLCGYYSGSGDRRILQALEMAYSNNPDWMRQGWGMSNPWPAFETYTWTGNRQIASGLNAIFAKDGGGRNPGGTSWSLYRQPPKQEPGAEENDHVVHFLETTTPWIIGYLWTGDDSFLKATLGWHDFFEKIAMQPNGVPVADEWYHPTGAFRGTETCDVAAYLWSKVMLLAVTGKGEMADRMERAFFNAAPATVSRDFKTHVYFQSPNRVVSGSPVFDHGPRASGGNYKPFHYPLCCTAALNRILPWFITHMWMATYDNGLAATCYGPCKISALAADHVPVDITCKTDYPFNEDIEIKVKPVKEATFPLLLRIPGWCQNPELKVNGTTVDTAKNDRGFVRLNRAWKAGDTIQLRFPMTTVVSTGIDQAKGTAKDHQHKPDKLSLPEENKTPGKPYATVSYGPLLFALAIPDIGDANTPNPAARWKFALDVKNPGVTVTRGSMPAKWDWPLSVPLSLSVNAKPIEWDPQPHDPSLPMTAATGNGPAERIKLVPYGCTKFRISMFPVIKEQENL
ncbi:MAG: hypothetical protein A2283_21470 [Lentisphaerae bacterium RIFOXYA12_FULL_48_11]|nr:MAG: hypothetical protein A2283_21470 [Lentisphaerae bacterium RIFOXYA12_FULL_48_11]